MIDDHREVIESVEHAILFGDRHAFTNSLRILYLRLASRCVTVVYNNGNTSVPDTIAKICYKIAYHEGIENFSLFNFSRTQVTYQERAASTNFITHVNNYNKFVSKVAASIYRDTIAYEEWNIRSTPFTLIKGVGGYLNIQKTAEILDKGNTIISDAELDIMRKNKDDIIKETKEREARIRDLELKEADLMARNNELNKSNQRIEKIVETVAALERKNKVLQSEEATSQKELQKIQDEIREAKTTLSMEQENESRTKAELEKLKTQIKNQSNDIKSTEDEYNKLLELREEKRALDDSILREVLKRGGKYKNKWTQRIKEKEKEHSFVCGTTMQERGFIIKGIRMQEKCKHQFAAEYAVVFAYLQRRLHAEKSNHFKYLEREVYKREFNLQGIYRLQLAILLLIKNNYIVNQDIKLRIIDLTKAEIELAIDDLNHYADMLCRLAKTVYIPLTFDGTDGLSISVSSLSSDADILFYDSDIQDRSGERQPWIEDNIIFHVDQENENYLYELAVETFAPGKFVNFLPGQLEAIKDMLNEMGNSICIMPTGSGKSYVYYMVALLRSAPTIIVSPTRILIDNQIEHLKEIHKIDDAIWLEGEVDYTTFLPKNKFVFMTPDVLQDYSLIFQIIFVNRRKAISNIILDEVHCISNWGHDFRPDYLMLSQYLNEFACNVRLKCFTATANYLVLDDVAKQLSILPERVTSPIKMKKDNFSFDFKECYSDTEVLTQAAEISTILLRDSGKTMVFVSDQGYACQVYNMLNLETKKEAVVFQPEEPGTYESFANGSKKILIAYGEVGIGIDLPGITNILHVGYPSSKANFVQEIGRAGRAGEKCRSTVIYRSSRAFNVTERNCVDMNASTNSLVRTIRGSNIGGDIFSLKKLIAISDEDYTLKLQVADILAELDQESKDYIDWAVKIEEALDIKQQLLIIQRYLYVLYRVGFVECWFMKHIDNELGTAVFHVERHREKPMVDRKKKLRDYMRQFGRLPEYMDQINKAENVKDLNEIFIEWYYNEFIYHHRRQFWDVICFFEQSVSKKNEDIQMGLRAYFSIDLYKVERDEKALNDASVREVFMIAEMLDEDSGMRERVEQGLSKTYHARSDLFVLLRDLILNEYASNIQSRLLNIWSNIAEYERTDLVTQLCEKYGFYSLQNRYDIFQVLQQIRGITKALDEVYLTNTPDLIYYGTISQKINTVINKKENKYDREN